MCKLFMMSNLCNNMYSVKLKIVYVLSAIVIIIGAVAFVINPSEMVVPGEITSEELSVLSKNDLTFVIDIRSIDDYILGHIPGSAFDEFEEKTLEKRMKTIHSRLSEIDEKITLIVVDSDGNISPDVHKSLTNDGFSSYYLKNGMMSWNDSLISSNLSPTVTSSELWSSLKNNDELFLLDVREPHELEKTMISGSVNIPISNIFEFDSIHEIPQNTPVVVICGSGNRATIASYQLAQDGIQFQVLEGGIIAWDKFLDEHNYEKI